MKVTVKCDRCGKSIQRIHVPDVATAGYYMVGKGKAFERYARQGESIVCDDCMHADPAYRADYGIKDAA